MINIMAKTICVFRLEIGKDISSGIIREELIKIINNIT